MQELGNILGTQTARRDAVNSKDNWYTNVGYFPVFISLYLTLSLCYRKLISLLSFPADFKNITAYISSSPHSSPAGEVSAGRRHQTTLSKDAFKNNNYEPKWGAEK